MTSTHQKRTYGSSVELALIASLMVQCLHPIGQQKLILLMLLMAVVWSLSHGCPIGPGPTCLEELPNAISIINRLKKSLKDFYKTLVVCTRADCRLFLFT